MARRTRSIKVKKPTSPKEAGDGRLSLDYAPPSSFVFYENNPRANAPAVNACKNSIRQFGFVVPVLVESLDSMLLVAGHTRVMAALELGLDTIPFLVASHLSKAQLDAFRVVDNKISELSEWDFDKLQDEIAALPSFDFTDFGWTNKELDSLTADFVADDCLSLAEYDEVSSEVSTRTTERVRVVVGDYSFFLSVNAYNDWVTEKRERLQFNEGDIKAEILNDLGFDPEDVV